MKSPVLVLLAAGGGVAVAGLCWLDATSWVWAGKPASDASPIFGVRIPAGYRDWTLVAPAQEAAPLDELRSVVGNGKALKAYRANSLPFPDGTVLVKLAWKHMPSPDFPPPRSPARRPRSRSWSRTPSATRRRAAGALDASSTASQSTSAQHETCFACHAARVEDRDYVFTRYAP
jgi:hypothetical protein